MDNNTPNTSAVEPRNKGLFAGLIIVIVLLALGAIILYAYSGARDMDSDYDDNSNGMNAEYQTDVNGGANTTGSTATSSDDTQEINSIETEVNALNSAELE